MSQTYRVRIKASSRRRRAYLLLIAGALCLYIAARMQPPSAMRLEEAPAVLVTQDVVLPGRQIFIVCMGCEPDSAAALAASARYAHRGAAGAIWPAEGSCYAAGAVFCDELSAEAHARALVQAENIPAQVLVQELPELTLRITASQRQIDSLTGAEAALYQVSQELGDIALRVDSGQTDMTRAQKDVLAQQARLDAARERLAQSIDGEREPISRALADLLCSHAEDLLALSQENSLARLQFSSAVRAQEIGLLRSLFAWRQSMRAA